ncbi:MAG: GNAT family N-acetyltransferase [Gammaproteobacteria bacterium]
MGKLITEEDAPTIYEKSQLYDLIVAKIPHQKQCKVNLLEDFGFRYIGLDVALEVSKANKKKSNILSNWEISHIKRSAPGFEIDGFQIEDSRLMLDPYCREKLPVNFWDKVVREHCEDFADVVICASDETNRLSGFISCKLKKNYLDMFLVAVHPSCQGEGLGAILVNEAMTMARRNGLPVRTSVMASNIHGFNFYLSNGFRLIGSEVVMHNWKKREQ